MDAQTSPPPEAVALGLCFGKMAAMAVSVVCKLRVPDQLAEGPKSADELAAVIGAHGPSLARVMRALVGQGVFATDAEGRFALTPVGQLFRTGVPGSLRGIADYCGAPWSWNAWGALEQSVRTGQTAFDHVFGEPCFDHLAKYPAESAVFDEGMTGFSSITGPAIAEAYDFGQFTTVVDVGGGHGSLLLAILARYPNLHGIVFDAPHVVAGASPAIERAQATSRCRTAAGNFFESVPPGGDAYLMKHIIHDWNDDACLNILRNIRAVVPIQGKLLVCEMVVPNDDSPHPSKLLDLEMLTIAGGQERTAAEFTALLAKGGFEITCITPTKSPVCVIEARPV